VRDKTQQEPICIYCKQPITQQQWPYRTLASDKKAHLACYIDHMHDDEKKPPN
jgi:hypothetical protein